MPKTTDQYYLKKTWSGMALMVLSVWYDDGYKMQCYIKADEETAQNYISEIGAFPKYYFEKRWFGMILMLQKRVIRMNSIGFETIYEKASPEEAQELIQGVYDASKQFNNCGIVGSKSGNSH